MANQSSGRAVAANRVAPSSAEGDEDAELYRGAPPPPRLNVRLLKERLEMEVGLRREGLRALVFCFMCICFCVMLFLSTQPTMRNASRWYVSERLKLAQLKLVTSKDEAFSALMDIAARSREFYPLSSDYFDDPLSKTLLSAPTEFPSGPVELPAEQHPSLGLEWSATGRLKIHNPDDPLHKKRLIMRKVMSGDTSGKACWAWYCWGMDKFVLEYGRHNIDDFYPMAEFVLTGTDNFTTDLAGFNFIAITVNSSHVSLHVQGAETQSKYLLPGSVPSDCPGGVLELGDLDITLASLEYHPFVLSARQMEEIQHGGQILAEMATGVAMTEHVAAGIPEASDTQRQTQKMVSDYGEEILSVARLSGSLAFTASQRETGEGATVDVDLTGVSEDYTATLGSPLAVEPGAMPTWGVLGAEEDMFWPVVGTEGAMVGPLAQPTRQAVAANLTAALGGLSVAQQQAGAPMDFTYSWWTKAQGVLGMAEIAVVPLGSEDENPASGFGVRHFTEGDGVTTVSGWLITFQGSPWCIPGDHRCLDAPGMYCQSPDGVGYDGIWRHYAITFSHASRPVQGGNHSTLELFLDGHQLCGFSFPAAEDLIPHNLPSGAVAVAFMPIQEGDDGSEVEMKDARVYPRQLNGTEVKMLAADPKYTECLDTEVNFDNSLWLSEFGQSCADLATQSVAGTPAACRRAEVIQNCPVSCMHELAPMCYDGMPPLPKPGSTFMIGARLPIAQLYLELPVLAQAWIALDLPQEALLGMLDNAQFLGGGADGQWYPLNVEIKVMEYATIMTSTTAALSNMTTMWVSGYNMSAPDFCPGAGLDFQTMGLGYQALDADQKAIIQELCLSELLFADSMNRFLADLGADSLMKISGLDSTAFPDGLMPAGESFSMYFWAKTNNIQAGSAPRLIGIDSDHNICFSIRGAVAWLQQIGLVEKYEAWWAARNTTQAEDWQPEANTQWEAPAGGGAGEWNPWRSGRLEVEMPANGRNALKANVWTFFALVVDVAAGKARFALNGFVHEVDLPKGTWGSWGCSSLQYVFNTGSDMELSPMRVGRFALTAGSLQRIYLSARPDFVAVFQAEERSRLQRLARVQRTQRRFKGRMVALSPPMLLQRRVNSSAADLCTGETIEALNEQLQRRLATKCEAPFKCSAAATVEMRCPEEDTPAPTRFFGQFPMAMPGNISTFPEFAWTLQSSLLLRDGVELVPAQDYIDDETLEVTMILSTFVPRTQVATTLYVDFDMRQEKITSTVTFQQIKLLSRPEFDVVLAWAVAAIFLSFLSLALAMPAAIQEFLDFRRARQSGFRRTFQMVGGKRALKRAQSLEDRPAYTNNTTQPDILDVVMNVAFITLLISFIVNKAAVSAAAGDLFGKLAGIDWAGDSPLQEKMDFFLLYTRDAVEMVQEEETYLTAAFWILCIFCARVIVYMQMHPTIASVSHTFASVGRELVNFMFSFGIIFMFLAYIAHVRFGYLYEEFSTIRQSLITQFAILIGDYTPDYSTDNMMCIYVVGFVFVCSLSLLNFFLAIIVNGYTAVTERVLENKVAQSFPADMILVPVDMLRWLRNKRWPSKLAILNALYQMYPEVFDNEDVEVVRPLGLETFQEVVISASKHRAGKEDGEALFDYYCRMEVLLIEDAIEGVEVRNHSTRALPLSVPHSKMALLARRASGEDR